MGSRYFYDLPVYRLTHEAYFKARDEYVDKVLFPPDALQADSVRNMAQTDPRTLDVCRGALQLSYGGCWEFNEIIGFIRLHFLGTQVRGEYFGSPKKRIVRTRKKTFEYKTWKLVPEIMIEAPYSTAEVVAAIREYIEDCRRKLPRRYIDASLFETLAPYVDWARVLREHNA